MVDMKSIKAKMISLTKLSAKFMLLFLFGASCFSLGASVQRYSTPYLHNDWLKYTMDKEKQIPDRIALNQIEVYKDKLILYGNYELAEYANTDSMLPILDYGSNGIYIDVTNETHLYLGDIVSFKVPGFERSFIHRIVRIGVDEQGTYYKTKGDNILTVDPFIIRQDQIERVMIGVIW